MSDNLQFRKGICQLLFKIKTNFLDSLHQGQQDKKEKHLNFLHSFTTFFY